MIKSTFFVLVLAALGSAASAQTAAAPLADRFTETTVVDLTAQVRVREWDLASNSSNASEIYDDLVKAGGKPACQDTEIMVNYENVKVQNCSVTARVSPLSVLTNVVVVWPSRAVVDVEGAASCQAKWYAIAVGRSHQKAERWVYCQFKGAARAQ